MTQAPAEQIQIRRRFQHRGGAGGERLVEPRGVAALPQHDNGCGAAVGPGADGAADAETVTACRAIGEQDHVGSREEQRVEVGATDRRRVHRIAVVLERLDDGAAPAGVAADHHNPSRDGGIGRGIGLGRATGLAGGGHSSGFGLSGWWPLRRPSASGGHRGLARMSRRTRSPAWLNNRLLLRGFGAGCRGAVAPRTLALKKCLHECPERGTSYGVPRASSRSGQLGAGTL